MSKPTSTLVTLCGSLRADSWNARVLRAAEAQLGAGWRAVHTPLGDLPLYDQDAEDAGAPPPVVALRDAVAAADAVLCATPQYNHGISGVLKNALDWLSRPAFAGVLVGKPAGVIAVTTGRHVPDEAVAQTETTLEVCVAQVIRPGVSVASIGRAVADDGAFSDTVTEALRDLIGRLTSSVQADSPS